MATTAQQHHILAMLLACRCVFLYPPAVVWLEALAETRSRINACAHHSAKHRMVFRWTSGEKRFAHQKFEAPATLILSAYIAHCRFHRDMHTDKLNVSMWRKSSQWVILNR